MVSGVDTLRMPNRVLFVYAVAFVAYIHGYIDVCRNYFCKIYALFQFVCGGHACIGVYTLQYAVYVLSKEEKANACRVLCKDCHNTRQPHKDNHYRSTNHRDSTRHPLKCANLRIFLHKPKSYKKNTTKQKI